jgi:hypothetical protein
MTDLESPEMQIIPLDEIVPGAVIRVAMIENVQYLSVRDVIMHVCNKNSNDAGQILRRIKAEILSELQTFCRDFKFPGQGHSVQPVITFPGAIKLAMFLPGECAKKNRSLMASIIVRYYAGDPSLIREIEANAMSDACIPSMARESIFCDGESTKEEFSLKRKREELELLKLETEARKGQAQSYTEIAQAYTDICSNSIMDEHAKNVFKEAMLSTVQGKCTGRNDNENKSRETAKNASIVLAEKNPTFTFVESARWPNTNPLVDKYSRLDDMETDNEYEIPQMMYKDKELNQKFKGLLESDSKYGILGFQYHGPRITSHNLCMCQQVKEAYGIKRDGKQFLILILRRGHEVKPHRAWAVLYRLGLLPRFFLLHSISLYSPGIGPVKDDMILDTVKQPADDKWSWHI